LIKKIKNALFNDILGIEIDFERLEQKFIQYHQIEDLEEKHRSEFNTVKTKIMQYNVISLRIRKSIEDVKEQYNYLLEIDPIAPSITERFFKISDIRIDEFYYNSNNYTQQILENEYIVQKNDWKLIDWDIFDQESQKLIQNIGPFQEEYEPANLIRKIVQKFSNVRAKQFITLTQLIQNEKTIKIETKRKKKFSFVNNELCAIFRQAFRENLTSITPYYIAYYMNTGFIVAFQLLKSVKSRREIDITSISSLERVSLEDLTTRVIQGIKAKKIGDYTDLGEIAEYCNLNDIETAFKVIKFVEKSFSKQQEVKKGQLVSKKSKKTRNFKKRDY
jgi:hypothetical protein